MENPTPLDGKCDVIPALASAPLLGCGKTSDGYHTFDELYEHRNSLVLALMKAEPGRSWISLLHNDGTMFDGYFVAGLCYSTGDITYHLPLALWDLAQATAADVFAAGLKWDGHTSADVINRLRAWVAA